MKKKMILKNWVKKVLLTILVIALIVSAMDFESTKTFMIVHLIAGVILVIDIYILWTQTDIFE